MNSKDTVLLSSTYLGPIEYYQQLVNYPIVLIEQHDHYIKQTYRNRCNIIGPEGIQSLIVPIIKPTSDKRCMKDILISEHGNWQHQHWQAIKTAYHNSPYYDYFEEDLAVFYSKKQQYLFDFNNQLQEVVCKLINICPNISYTPSYVENIATNVIDLRDDIHPKKENDSSSSFKRYYQVFEEKHQFSPNLSVLDLLFNMGPESIFYLRKDYL